MTAATDATPVMTAATDRTLAMTAATDATPSMTATTNTYRTCYDSCYNRSTGIYPSIQHVKKRAS